MREDYQAIYNRLRLALVKIGARAVSQDQLEARFELKSGWVLSLICEKYYGPIFTISVQPPEGGQEFAVWILMWAFTNLTGESYGVPTIENQVDFIEKKQGVIFHDMNFYSGEYDRLDSYGASDAS